METNTKNKGDILADRIEIIIETGHAHYLVSDIKAAVAKYRKQWTLGRSVNGFTLGDGQEWHRNDFTEDMLPDGWRPLLLGEWAEIGDQDAPISNWKEAYGGFYTKGTIRCRTRRPLPEVKKPVPLGPEDVKCGDVVSVSSQPQNRWMIIAVETVGIRTFAGLMTWSQLKDQDYKISRDGGKTWEACSK
jgi:hypothetical protein